MHHFCPTNSEQLFVFPHTYRQKYHLVAQNKWYIKKKAVDLLHCCTLESAIVLSNPGAAPTKIKPYFMTMASEP